MRKTNCHICNISLPDLMKFKAGRNSGNAFLNNWSMAALADRCLYTICIYWNTLLFAGGSDAKSSGSSAQGSCQCLSQPPFPIWHIVLCGTWCCHIIEQAQAQAHTYSNITYLAHHQRPQGKICPSSHTLPDCCSLSSSSIAHELPGSKCPLTYFTSTDSA